MDMKTMLIQWALLFLTNATDGNSSVTCTVNKELMARGITAITCDTPTKDGILAVSVTFAPHKSKLPPSYDY
jgi:hypothetical protein